MLDLLGYPLEDALAVLESRLDKKTVILLETSGYKATYDMSGHTEVRVVGVREKDTETLLLTAKF